MMHHRCHGHADGLLFMPPPRTHPPLSRTTCAPRAPVAVACDVHRHLQGILTQVTSRKTKGTVFVRHSLCCCCCCWCLCQQHVGRNCSEGLEPPCPQDLMQNSWRSIINIIVFDDYLLQGLSPTFPTLIRFHRFGVGCPFPYSEMGSCRTLLVQTY